MSVGEIRVTKKRGRKLSAKLCLTGGSLDGAVHVLGAVTELNNGMSHYSSGPEWEKVRLPEALGFTVEESINSPAVEISKKRLEYKWIESRGEGAGPVPSPPYLASGHNLKGNRSRTRKKRRLPVGK